MNLRGTRTGKYERETDTSALGRLGSTTADLWGSFMRKRELARSLGKERNHLLTIRVLFRFHSFSNLL